MSDSEPHQPHETEPQEPTEPVVPAVPAEPVLPPEPTEPVVPAEPAQPVVPAEPVEPVVPAEPTEPVMPPADVLSEEEQLLLDPLAGVPLPTALEALLIVADEPMPEVVLAQQLQQPEPDIRGALEQLSSDYAEQGRGFELRQVAGGWRFYTAAQCAPIVERYVRDGQTARLTQAALETLAVVAYKQPVSRARVSAVRGVNVDGVMRTLVNRGLVEEAGTEGESGATLYRTSNAFLERMGLDSLEQLPELAPFLPDFDALDDVEEAHA